MLHLIVELGQATFAVKVDLFHSGLYTCHTGYVAKYVAFAPSPQEQSEQPRVLWHGGHIAIHITDSAPPAGVDTREDFDRARSIILGVRA